MPTPEQLAQIRRAQRLNTQPLHDFNPWSFQRQTLRLYFSRKYEYWIVKQQDTKGNWSAGVPATNYLVSLWLDLLEARAAIRNIQKQLDTLRNQG